MSNRTMVWLSVMLAHAVLGFIAGLFGPVNWLFAPFFGYSFRKEAEWSVVMSFAVSLFVGGSLSWALYYEPIMHFPLFLIGSTLTVLLYLGGALYYDLRNFIRIKRAGSAPSNPSSGGNSMFRRLLPKCKQENRDNVNRLQASVIPTA